MQKVYFISGLGADWRVFSTLDLSFCEPVFMDWIKPQKNELLSSYALRLKENIPEPHPLLVGLSFGGMLVTEMAKADPQCKAVIISSNKTSDEFPRILRAGKYIPFYKWIPNGLSKKMAVKFRYLLGSEEKEQKEIIRDIIRDTDMSFVKWAIHAIMHWKNKTVPTNLVHIHGTNDKLLYFSKVKADHKIIGGRHVMTLDKPEEISTLLKRLLSSNT